MSKRAPLCAWVVWAGVLRELNLKPHKCTSHNVFSSIYIPKVFILLATCLTVSMVCRLVLDVGARQSLVLLIFPPDKFLRSDLILLCVFSLCKYAATSDRWLR